MTKGEHTRTGQTLYPLHNFFVRVDKNIFLDKNAKKKITLL